MYKDVKMKNKFLFLVTLMLFCFAHAFAQTENKSVINNEAQEKTVIGSTAEKNDTALVSDDDELFGGGDDDLFMDETLEETVGEEKPAVSVRLDGAGVLIEAERLRFGGSLNTGLDLQYGWEDPYKKQSDPKQFFLDPAVQALQTHIDATLFFDARPTKTVKIYGSFGFGFPFTKSLNGAIVVPKTLPVVGGMAVPVRVSGSPNFRILELYTDFSIKDIAFFRFGKHSVKWGVGYFYSPADVINLSAIDPANPTLEREGPVSLRVHVIFPGTLHNLWMYVLPDTTGFDPKKTAGAVKGEFVVNDWELGVSAWYQYQRAPRFIFTATGSIAGKVSVFTEGVFAWGSDYTYHKDDSGFTAYTEKNKPFFQATAGLMYTHAESSTSIAVQYFYNGFGYINPKPLIKRVKSVDPKTIPAVFADIGSMVFIGQHYVALLLNQNKIGTDRLGASLFAQYGFSELAGMVTLSLNWNPVHELRLKTGVTFNFGKGSLFTEKVQWNIGASFGGGKF